MSTLLNVLSTVDRDTYYKAAAVLFVGVPVIATILNIISQVSFRTVYACAFVGQRVSRGSTSQNANFGAYDLNTVF